MRLSPSSVITVPFPSPSVTGSLVYGTDGNYSNESFAYNSIGSIHGDNGLSDAAPSFGYDNCFTLDSSNTPLLIRLHAVYISVDVFVIPDGGTTLPSQGILIESIGVVSEATKKVSVIRSSSYVPLPFDFAIFQTSQTEPLAN